MHTTTNVNYLLQSLLAIIYRNIDVAYIVLYCIDCCSNPATGCYTK